MIASGLPVVARGHRFRLTHYRTGRSPVATQRKVSYAGCPSEDLTLLCPPCAGSDAASKGIRKDQPQVSNHNSGGSKLASQRRLAASLRCRIDCRVALYPERAKGHKSCSYGLPGTPIWA